MSTQLGTVKPGSMIYIPFASYDKDDGSSITMTGLAVTDVECYKDGGTTQRASDNGYTLLDTDGIDFDALTGIHGFSINLADNSTAGFWAAGSRYFVVVSAITIDAVAVSFIAAEFTIGYPNSVLDTTIATLSSQTSFTLTVGPAEDDALNNMWVIIHDVASAVQFGWAQILDYTGSTKTVTLVAGTTFTAAATDNISIMGIMPLLPTVTGRTLDVSAGGEAGLDWANIGSPTTAQNLSGTNIDVDQIVASVSGAVGSVTGSVGSVTARVTANVDQLGGVAQSLTDLKDFADDGYDPATNKVEGVKLADTLTTYTGNTPQTGDNFARLGAPAGASVSADIAAIEAQTDDIGVAGAGLTAIPWNAAWDAEVQSEAADALVAYDPPTGAELVSEINSVQADIAALNNLSAAQVNTEVDTAIADARLDELLAADSDIDGAAPPTVGSVFHELMSKTAGSFTYDQTTDSNEAIRDNMGTPQTGDVFPLASTEIADIKAKTDQLTFTTANQLDSNVKGVSDDSAAADAFETMLDGTGGQTLSLGKLDINNPSGDAISAVSSGGAGRGIYAKGEGAGHGALIEGGGAAHGIYGKGGSSAGSGLRGDGAGASAGIAGVGATGPGIHGLGGTNSHGLLVQSAVGGDGIRAIGEGVGHGARFTKGASGKDIDADEIDQIVTDTTTDIPSQITALNNLSSAQAQTAAAAALTAYDPPTRTEATADKDEILTQLPSAPVKNTAFTYVIKMVDSTDHATPETLLTIAMTRSLDGAAFGVATGVVTEISTGHYKVAASAADMNGDVVTHRFTATGADDLTIEFKTVS